MASSSHDPSAWDTERLIEVLCAPGNSWVTTATALADRIRDLELDGSTLLDVGKYFSFQQLFDDLGIKKYPHRSALGNFIESLRHGNELPLPEVKRKKAPTPEPPTRLDAPAASEEQPHKRKRLNMSKLVVVEPSGNAPTNIPTAADAVAHWAAAPQKKAAEAENSLALVANRSPGEYYGRGFLKRLAIFSPTESISNRKMLGDEDNFVLVGQNTTPEGLQRAVARAQLQLLCDNSRRELRINAGVGSSDLADGDDAMSLSDLPDEVDEQTRREMEEEAAEAERARRKDMSPERVREILSGCIAEMECKWTETKLARCPRKHYKYLKSIHHANRRKDASFQAKQRIQHLDGRITKLCNEIEGQQWTSEESVRSQARVIDLNVEERMEQRWLTTALQSRELPRPPLKVRQPRPAKEPPANAHEEILESTDDDSDFIVPDDETFPEDPRALFSPIPPMGSTNMDMVDLTQRSPEKKKPAIVETPSRAIENNVIDLTQSPVRSAFPPLQAPASPTPQVEQKTSPNNPKLQALLDKMPSLGELGSLEEITKIPPHEWQKQGDRFRVLVCLLWSCEYERRTSVLNAVKELSQDEIRSNLIKAYLDEPLQNVSELVRGGEKVLQFDMVRLLVSFQLASPIKETRFAPLKKMRKHIEKILPTILHVFCVFIKDITPGFPQADQIYRMEDLEAEGIDAMLLGDGAFEEEVAETPSKKRKTREVVRNKAAVDLRAREALRTEALEAKKRKLEAVMAAQSQGSEVATKPIVNAAKEEGQAFVYINDERISSRITDYQVKGVRFLWEQIVRPPDVRQGALLAHTMGLGKTMQVITFLIVLAQAAANPGTQEQVPDDLRDPRILVICPSSLVENWEDEILKWLPPDAQSLLGDIFKFDNNLHVDLRLARVKQWSESKGILILGDGMIRTGTKHDETNAMQELLLASATIVVLDEAHSIKNVNTNLNRFCVRFKTSARIALTGSPLSNNVEEYYYIIDWIAPNYLGPISEFKEIYVIPINNGFEKDAPPVDRRRAFKVLYGLLKTIGPKIDRQLIDVLRGVLPQKSEFVLSLTATTNQQSLYTRYIQDTNDSKVLFFEKLSDLGLICNHPSCLYDKLQDAANKEKDPNAWYKDILDDLSRDKQAGYNILSPTLSNKVRLLDVILDEARKMKEKVLVFSQSLVTLDFLAGHFQRQGREFSRLDGQTKTHQRVQNVKEFNMGGKEVYLIATRAGGVGLNIYGANRVVLFDSSLNPTHDQQAIGRAYRLGQTKPVLVYHLMIAGSFEASKQQRSVFKSQLASRVVDKKNPIASVSSKPKLIHPIQEVEQTDLSPMIGKDRILDHLIGPQYGHLVRSIISTDAFELEDADAKLTAEEQAEADNMMAMAQTRTTNPAQYSKLMEQSMPSAYANAPSPQVPSNMPLRATQPPWISAQQTGNSSEQGASVPGQAAIPTQPHQQASNLHWKPPMIPGLASPVPAPQPTAPQEEQQI